MGIDVEKLLKEVGPDAPSGENLEYDAGFAELERSARGKPEQQMGDTVIPGEEPNWGDVRSRATELLGRSKDLRVAVHLAQAALRLEGLQGFCDGLGLIRGLLQAFWDGVYPQLDPEDDNDPTMRVNALAPLTDPDTTLRALRETLLVQSRAVGQFSYRDYLLATGALPTPAGKKAPEIAAIDAAFTDAPLESLQGTERALAGCLEHVRGIESELTDRVGSEQTADLSPLAALVRSIRQVVAERVARRAPSPEEAPAEGAPAESGEEAPRGSQPPAAVRVAPGEIHTREDVVKAIDRVCDYFAKYEPSSPIPLLLRRAQRLAGKSFIDIIQDLAPNAISEIEKIRGVDSDPR